VTANQGKKIYFPAGTYLYTGGATLGVGTIVCGDGRNTSIIMKTNNTGTQFTCSGRGSGVQSLGFNATSDQTSTSYYVRLSGVESFINDFAMTKHFHGVYMTGSVSRIRHGRLQYASPNAICVFAGGGDNSQVIDDILLGAQDGPNIAEAGIKVSDCVALTITNVSVIQMGTGLLLESDNNDNKVLNFIATDCYFDNCNYPARLVASGTGSVSRVKFTNVWFGSSQIALADGVNISNTGTGLTQGFDFVNCQSVLNNGSGLTAGGNASAFIGDLNIIGGQYSNNKYGVFINSFVDRVKITDAALGAGAGLLGNTQEGLVLSNGVSNCIVADNIIIGNSIPVTNTTTSPSTVIISNNLGYVTAAQSSTIVLSGSTTKIVTHGLNVTPSNADIFLSPASGLSGTLEWYADNANATTFTINVSPAPSTNISFNWMIRTKNS
jgi:hypothetical protein